MGKDKLKRFAENETFSNLYQPQFPEVFRKDFHLKGKWNSEVFKNNNPIVLELGCGRCEYTIGMGRFNPDKNYIGIDIKGARLWRGAKTATEDKMSHIAFIRTNIELLGSFFAQNEVSEIWITFPDPQLKVRRAKKRLTGSLLLNQYKKVLNETGTINLKTDSAELFQYTNELLNFNQITPITNIADIYASAEITDLLKIKTHYESIFLKVGKPINYLQFALPEKEIIELPNEEIEE